MPGASSKPSSSGCVLPAPASVPKWRGSQIRSLKVCSPSLHQGRLSPTCLSLHVPLEAPGVQHRTAPEHSALRGAFGSGSGCQEPPLIQGSIQTDCLRRQPAPCCGAAISSPCFWYFSLSEMLAKKHGFGGGCSEIPPLEPRGAWRREGDAGRGQAGLRQGMLVQGWWQVKLPAPRGTLAAHGDCCGVNTSPSVTSLCEPASKTPLPLPLLEEGVYETLITEAVFKGMVTPAKQTAVTGATGAHGETSG